MITVPTVTILAAIPAAMLWFILALVCVSKVALSMGLGMVIKPVMLGDDLNYLGLTHLENCVAYPMYHEDVAVVLVDVGDRIASQNLELRVFDESNNLLRNQRGLEQLHTFLLSSAGDEKPEARHHHTKEQLKPPFIYICFDNIYQDMLWSFNPKNHEVYVTVDIKAFHAMNATKFELYTEHVGAFNTTGTVEENFDRQMASIKSQLNSVQDSMRELERNFDDLVAIEKELRNLNEFIFEDYTHKSLMIFLIIVLVGLAQVFHTRRIVQRAKLI